MPHQTPPMPGAFSMERNSEPPKLMSSDRRPYKSLFNVDFSEDSNNSSPLIKYLCSAEPEINLPPYSPPDFIASVPVKFEGDVLVMDGIPVLKSNRGNGEPRSGSSFMSSDSSFNGFACMRSSSSSSLSGGGGSSGSGSGRETSGYKAELCFHFQQGQCHFGNRCRKAHGVQELRPSRIAYPIKNSRTFDSSEYPDYRAALLSPTPSSSTATAILPSNSTSESSTSTTTAQALTAIEMLTSPEQVKPTSESNTTITAQPSPPEPLTSPEQVKPTSESNASITAQPSPPEPLPTPPNQANPTSESSTTKAAPLLSSYWTPMDDGIPVTLPVYGTSSRKRLPVFEEICPSDKLNDDPDP